MNEVTPRTPLSTAETPQAAAKHLPKMIKRVEQKEDGRKLIYYTFAENSTSRCTSETGQNDK